MKTETMKTGIAFVVAVASCSVLAQGILKLTNAKSDWKRGKNAETLRKRQNAEAFARREACEKFGLAIEPGGWTNGCGKGLILFGADGKYYKYDRDGRLLQFGDERDFEELVWLQDRKTELLANPGNGAAAVGKPQSNNVENVSGPSAKRVEGHGKSSEDSVR